MPNRSPRPFSGGTVHDDRHVARRHLLSPQATALRPAEVHARSPRIAVIDRLPAYRHGLVAGLSVGGFEAAGFAIPSFDPGGYDAMVMTLGEQRDWESLAVMRTRHPGLAVVVLLSDIGIGSHRRALRLGVAGVVAQDAGVDDIVTAVEAALAGNMLLPRHVVRRLLEAEAEADAHAGVALSDCEVGWLRAMARGATVAGVAEAARYSERQMHRLIRCLYLRMGASTRQEALVLAARWGVLD